MTRRARHLWAVLLPGVCLQAPVETHAALDPTDVVQIQASTSLIRDSNLFRLPDVNPALFGIDPSRKADTARVLGVGLKVDKLLSRQRLIADLNVSESTYDKNDNLDFFGGDGRLGWQWQVGNLWSGEASLRKRRTLGGFSDFRQNVQDLIDTDTYIVSAGYQFHPRWRISAEVSQEDVRHSAATRISLDSDSRTAGTEVRYRTPAQNSVGVQLRRTDRLFPNRTSAGAVILDNAHVETRLNAVATWQFTGALRLDGQIGQVDVQFDQLARRNYSGLTWRAAAAWDPTPKLRINLNTTRDLRLFEDIATSYVVANNIGLQPIYALTAKVQLQGDLGLERRAFRGDPGFVPTNLNREDTTRLHRIGVVYSPIRNIDLSLSYEAGDRKSTSFLNGFDYRSWFGTLRVGF